MKRPRKAEPLIDVILLDTIFLSHSKDKIRILKKEGKILSLRLFPTTSKNLFPKLIIFSPPKILRFHHSLAFSLKHTDLEVGRGRRTSLPTAESASFLSATCLMEERQRTGSSSSSWNHHPIFQGWPKLTDMPKKEGQRRCFHSRTKCQSSSDHWKNQSGKGSEQKMCSHIPVFDHYS